MWEPTWSFTSPLVSSCVRRKRPSLLQRGYVQQNCGPGSRWRRGSRSRGIRFGSRRDMIFGKPRAYPNDLQQTPLQHLHGGFPKFGVPCWGSQYKDYSILVSILGSPYFGKLPHEPCVFSTPSAKAPIP